MCRTQCVLALAALYVGLVHSWDIAVSVGDQLEFYTDGTKTDTVHLKFHNLTAITYDEVHNMMLFVDKQRNNDAICGYNLSSKNIKCFVKRFGSNIHDIAFDPATDLLFFTDRKDRSINWISLKNQGSEYNVYGNLLIKMVEQIPSDIQVDSCNGFIYWTNSVQRLHGYHMERARFNGFERDVIDRFIRVNSFAIDLQTQKNYFFTGSWYDALNKVDLRVKNIMKGNRKIFYNKPRSAQELTISKDYLYWTQSSASDKTVWQMLKNATIFDAKPKEVCRFYTGHTIGIAANYRIKDQVHGLQDCEALARLIPILEIEQTTELDWSTESEQTETTEQGSTAELDWSKASTETTEEGSTTELDWSTKNTETTEQGSTTELDWSIESEQTETTEQGFTAELDWSTGSTETTEQGSTAELDWSTKNTETTEQGSTTGLDWSTGSEQTETTELGSTAELDWTTEIPKKDHACHGYCLNNGNCSLNKKSEPVCHCKGDYVGDRCEVSGCINYCFQGSCSLNDEGHPKCRCSAGYSGARCEVYACHSYCLNSGACSLNKKNKPVCRCIGNHEGTRCQAVKQNTFSYTSQTYSANRNLTLTDLVTNWRKRGVKVSVIVEV